jgi:hypothetical protein
MNSNFKLLLERLKKIEPVLYIFLILVLLFPIWANKYFITQDGPMHLHNAKIFLDYLTHHHTEFYNQYFRTNFIAFPYWFGHLFMAFILWICPKIMAEKLVYSVYIILFAFLTRKTIKYINKESLFLSYLILPFACNYSFQWGFIPYLYSFLFFSWTVIFWLKHQSDFRTKHAIIIGLLSLVIYFTHIVFWVFSIVTIFTLLGFSILSNTTNIMTFFNEIKKSSRKIVLLLISIVPSFILYYIYFKNNPTLDLGVKYYSQDYIINGFIRLRTLVLVSEGESKYAIYLGILLLLLSIFCFVKKFQLKKITIYDGFYFAAFIALIVNIYFTINHMGFLERLQFLPLIFLIFWFASFEFSTKIKFSVILFSFIITALFVSARYPTYKRASDTVEELLSAQPYIKDNKTILFLGYNKKGVAPDKEEVTSLLPSGFIQLELFIHSGNYFGINRPIIVLDNPAALYPQFPYVWRSDKCVYSHIQQINSPDGIDGTPPDVDLLSYTPTTKGSIDYVALRNFDVKFADNPKTIKLFQQLAQDYREVFVSKTGIIKLYKKITAEDIMSDLNKNNRKENFFKLCKYYFNNEQYEKCIEISENNLSKFSSDKEIWAYCGASYLQLDQTQKSINYLIKSLKISPDYDFAARELLLAKSVAQADSVFNISQNPQQLVYLSSFYYNNKHYLKCIHSCEKALIYSPDNADAYNNICSAYNCLGDFKKADEACKKALVIRPDYELAKNNLKIAEDGLETSK